MLYLDIPYVRDGIEIQYSKRLNIVFKKLFLSVYMSKMEAACFGNYKLSAQVVEHIWKTILEYPI